MKPITTSILPFVAVTLLSCSSTKKLEESRSKFSHLDSAYKQLQLKSAKQADSIIKHREYGNLLELRLHEQKDYNDQMVNQLKELSVISSSQAESIKKSLENISSKDSYIRNLQSAISRKDSLTMNLVMNLKGAIGNLNYKDIKIKIDKGVIYIDISDKLLFKTGSYEITPEAREVLGKVAQVLLRQPDIEFMVEGHTDSIPFMRGVLLDNWDLSVKRATAVVRVLQYEYLIPPARMTDDSEYGRSLNRRTRIMILPELDQFFKLLEHPQN
jgi:chemotaxis protein MotB